MATAVESAPASQAEEPSPHAVQPEVQKYLEAVFAVAPFPEEYVRYRLHLATALPLTLIDSWFERRRRDHQRQEEEGVQPQNVPSGASATAEAQRDGQEPDSSHFSLFGAPLQRSGPGKDTVSQGGSGVHRASEEVANVGATLRMMQSASQSGQPDASLAISKGSPPRLFDPLTRPSALTNGCSADHAPHANGGANGLSERAGKRSSREEPSAAPSSRFSEADLESISSLVGLETITSTQEHCGSRSLFMFEQLTALDSLDLEGAGANKRRRTRHQHFWRNTDKLDPEERVYVPTSSIKPALKRRECVLPKLDISPEERTNAWTVCLTTRGVVSYLNKRISPLGVRLIRALQSSAGYPNPALALQPYAGMATGNGSALGSPSPDKEAGLIYPRPKRLRPVRPAGDEFSWDRRDDPNYHPANGTPSAASDDEEEPPNERHRQHLDAANTLAAAMGSNSVAAFEPIPRARKRKPG